MKFESVFPYKFKKIIPMLGLAGATLMTPSCSKDDDVPARDIEIEFDQHTLGDAMSEARTRSTDKTVNTIYMTVTGSWTNFNTHGILRTHEVLQEVIDDAPKGKIRGRGNFKFTPGVANPSDSIWFVNQGWTVNQHIQNQR